MGPFTILFGGKDKRAAMEQARQLGIDGDAKLHALWDLVHGVVNAADECTAEIARGVLIARPNAAYAYDFNSHLHRNLVFFFMHLMQRSAFQQLGACKRDKLIAIVGPFVVSMAVNTYWLNATEQLKEEMRSEFFGHLNESEEYYSAFPQLICEGGKFDGVADMLLCRREECRGVLRNAE